MREELIGEINRLTAVVQAMDAAMSGEGTVTDTPLKVYPKRRQNAASLKGELWSQAMVTSPHHAPNSPDLLDSRLLAGVSELWTG
jgi:hypothetical protein